MRKNYLPLLLAIVASLASLPALAIEAKDLVGKRFAILYLGNVAEDGLGVAFASGEVAQGSTSGQIVLKDFLGDFDLPLSLSNNRLTIANNVSCGAGNYGGEQWNDMKIRKAVRNTRYDKLGYYDYNYGVYSWDYGYAAAYGNIVSNAMTFDPEVRCNYFKFNDPFVTVFSSPDGDSFWLFGRMDLFIYDANATAKVYSGNSVIDTYPVRLTHDTDEDGDIMEILNWFNFGVGYENSVSNHTAYINNPVVNLNEDGTLDIPVMPIGGEVDSYCFWGSYTGDVFIANTDENCNSYGHYSSDRDNKGTRVQGTWTEGGVYHELDNDYWLTNHGGSQRTLEEPRTYTFLRPAVLKSSTLDVLESYDKIVITEDDPRDVTHDLSLNLTTCYKFDADGERYFYAEGSVLPGEQLKYVSHYELCMVPGFHEGISGLTQHAETGLEGATVIPEEYYMEKDTFSADGSPVLNFKVRVPASALNAVDANDRYSYFVKVHYTQPQAVASDNLSSAAPAKGNLFPLYGALTRKEIPTSVEVVDAAVKVYASAGCIVIEGDAGVKASVYDLAGSRIYAGGPGRVAVEPGAYIVRTGNSNIKIIVK